MGNPSDHLTDCMDGQTTRLDEDIKGKELQLLGVVAGVCCWSMACGLLVLCSTGPSACCSCLCCIVCTQAFVHSVVLLVVFLLADLTEVQDCLLWELEESDLVKHSCGVVACRYKHLFCCICVLFHIDDPCETDFYIWNHVFLSAVGI